VSSGAQVPRGREARSCRGGERSSFSAGAHGGGTHLWSSWERITLRGATREPWASAVARLACAQGALTRCAHSPREDSASRGSAPHDKRGVRHRFEKGTRPPKGDANLGSGRSGPAVHASSEARSRGSSAWKGKGAWRFVTSERSTRTRRSSRWCPCVVVLQKSAERPRAQRSAPSVAAGSKACPLYGAREREPDHRRRSGA